MVKISDLINPSTLKEISNLQKNASSALLVMQNSIKNMKNVPLSISTIDPVSFISDDTMHLIQTRKTNNHLENIAEKLNNLPNEEKLKEVIIEADKKKELLWLEYTPYQEVILNGVFLLHKCQAGGMNDRLLRYLLENPNQIFTRQHLFEKEILKKSLTSKDDVRSIGKETKTFYQFPEDIGISGDLKKLFFGNGLSKDTICLTNPIKKDNLNEARVGYIDIILKANPLKTKKNKA